MSLLNRLFLVVFVGLFVACTNSSYVPVGEVLEVKRGDRVLVPMTFIDPHSPPRAFDFLGIRCPDPDEDDNVVEAYYGVLARQVVDEWSHNRTVAVERPLRRENGLLDRTTGWLRDPATGEYIHELLLSKGLARANLQGRSLGERGSRIEALERQASAGGVGMFAASHPPEFEMRKVIKRGSLLGQLTSMLGGGDQKDPVKPIVPTQPPTDPDRVVPAQPAIPDKTIPQPVVRPGSVQKLLLQLNSETENARREFLNWQALPKDQRAARGAALRDRLRTLKIRLMDATDEAEGLDKVQQAFLEGLRSEMNRLMRLVPRS